jgi:hypothetical protein
VQQGLDRKTVAKVMQAWATTGVDGTQSNLPGQRVEGSVDLTFVEWVAVFVYEEVAVGSSPKPAIPTFHIIGKDLTGRSMHRYQPRLSKLGPANRENAFGPVHILRLKIQRLTEPQTRDCQ